MIKKFVFVAALLVSAGTAQADWRSEPREEKVRFVMGALLSLQFYAECKQRPSVEKNLDVTFHMLSEMPPDILVDGVREMRSRYQYNKAIFCELPVVK